MSFKDDLAGVVRHSLRNISNYIDTTSPKIKIGLGIASMTGAVISTAFVAPKVRDIHVALNKKYENEERIKERVIEEVKEVGPLIIAPVTCYGVGVGLTVSGYKEVDALLVAALSSAESYSKVLSNYRKLNLVEVGEEKEADIYKEAKEPVYKAKPELEEKQELYSVTKQSSELLPCYEKTLFRDWFGGYFWSTPDEVRVAQMELIRDIIIFGQQDVNDFRDYVHVAQVPAGKSMIFNKPEDAMFNFQEIGLTDNGLVYRQLGVGPHEA